MVGTGRSTRRTDTGGLGHPYEGLSGSGLLEKLANEGRIDVLEAFWRYGDPNLCAALVDPVLRTGASRLVRLMVDDILNPTIAEPLPTRLAQALGTHRPSIEAKVAARLAERLRDATPLANPQYESPRHMLEMWVLEQDGKLADDFAIDVVAGQTPRSNLPEVRQAAYRRCTGSKRALEGASKVVLAQLEGSPSATTWQTASDFVESTCQSQASPPHPVVPVVEKLLELAPSTAPVENFGPKLSRFAAAASRSALERLIGQDLPNTPGAKAVLRTIADVSQPAAKSRLFALAVQRQPHLWAVLQSETATWDESDWKRHLIALVRHNKPIEQGILTHLLNTAPLALTASVIELALSQAENPGETPLQVAGDRLRQHLDELGSGPEAESAWVDAIPWPRSGDACALAKLGSVLDLLEPNLRIRLVVLAYLVAKANAATAAALLPDGASYQALRKVEDKEACAVLAAALVDARSEEAADAIARLQNEEFSLEVAGTLASRLPGSAFSGAAAAFPNLGPGEKDQLVELLVQHSTQEQVPVLETVVADDHRENKMRRAKAAQRIAELTPEGGQLPQCVVDLLRSNIPELRKAGVHAIQTVKPRDPELVAQLHEVAQRGGDPGKAAIEALNVLATEFLDLIGKASTKAEVSELIPLLGASGRPQVLPQLFQYLGANAEYDDVTLHKAAANAIRQALST